MLNNNYIEEYEVNLGTLFIQGIDRNKCYVWDEYKQGVYLESVTSVMNKGCLIFGSTLNGRNEASSKLTGIKYKPPIIISEALKMIFFPCDSHKSTKCLWINLKKVSRIEAQNTGTIIEFTDGKRRYFETSNYIINNQYNKALKLYYTMFENDTKKHFI